MTILGGLTNDGWKMDGGDGWWMGMVDLSHLIGRLLDSSDLIGRLLTNEEPAIWEALNPCEPLVHGRG